jgi:DNA (cytosine-5)-methyltransferase 1
MSKCPERKPSHLDLCSGVGCFTLAARLAGFRTIGFSEVEKYCCKVLNEKFPEIKNYGDIGNVPAIKCELITAGFPCQPFSTAGRRKGKKDDRYIWPSVFDKIKSCQPNVCLIENVAGIIGLEIDGIIFNLENSGYAVQPFVIPSCAIGATIHRRRVWIVAKSIGQRHAQSRQLEKFKTPMEFKPCLYQSWPARPCHVSKIPRGTSGNANQSHRLKAIGNSITPQIAEIILKAIYRCWYE